MQVGRTRIVIRPALMMIFGGVAVGIAGIALASWYALGSRPSYGLAHPHRWAYGRTKSAQATLTMLTPRGTKELIPTRDGFSHLDTGSGFTVAVNSVAPSASSVYIRNTISIDQATVQRGVRFSFDGKAAQPFPVTFTIRDAQVKQGGNLLWSKTFVVQGDWKEYADPVSLASVGKRRLEFAVVAGHLGARPGAVSLRNIYVK